MIKWMSLFSQILSEISSSSVSFEHLVIKHGNDRNAKGFTSKTQLVSMIFLTEQERIHFYLSYVKKQMQDADLFEKWTLQGLLDDLDTI